MYKLKYSYTTRDAALLPIFIMLVSVCYSFLFNIIITKVAVANGATTAEQVVAFAALPWVNIINMLAGQIFALATYFVYSLINEKKIFTASTIKGKFRLYPILTTILITAVCIFGFNYLISIVDVGIVSLTGEPNAGLEVPTSVIGYIVVLIVFAVVPAIVEEFIYRGVVFNGLNKSYKPAVSILLSALIFALMHFGVHQFVYQFIMGVILAALTYFTGSILYGILFHLLNNLTVVTLSYFAPNIFVVNNINSLKIALIILGAILAAGVIVALFVLLYRLVKKHPTHATIPEEKTEKEQLIENSKGLSEYDVRQLNPTKLKDKTLIIILTIAITALWLIQFLA